MKKTFAYTALSQVVLLAIAQSAIANEQTVQLDEITVDGGSMYRMGEVPFHQAKSAVAITKETLDKEGVTKLDQLGRYQAGFTNQVYGNDTNTDWFKIRGADVTRAIDGKTMIENGFFTPRANVFGLEAVEVTKGADALAFGGSNAGGLINYVSKRPHQEQVGKGEFKTEFGNFNTHGVAADYTGAFNADQSARYRIVGQYRTADGEWDGTDNKTVYIAPSFEFDLSDKTRLTVLASYQRDSGTPSSQFLPIVGSLVPTTQGYIDRSTNLGDKVNDTETNKQYSIGYELSHNFGNGFKADSSYRYTFVDNYHRGSYYSYGGTTAPFTDMVRGFTLNDGIARSHNTDNRISYDFKNENLKNTVVVGTDYRYQTANGKYGYGSVTGTTYLFNPSAGYQDQSTIPDYAYKARQLGFYLQDNLTIADTIALSGGIRHDRARASAGNREAKENHTSYAGSVMYLSKIGVNPYYSYNESFKLPDGLSGNNELYKPATTKQHEVGIKYIPTWLDGTISVAYFHAKDNGALVAAPGGSLQADETKRKGVEVQVDANITPNLSTTLAYTYQRSETKAAGSTSKVRNPMLPQNSFSALVAYKFNDTVLNGLTVGAGVRHIGTTVYGDYKLPSATVADLMANYQINKNWSAQFNVQNVGDRRYVASCNWYCYYGEGRKMLANVSYKF